jgi:hypothetical protein
MPFNGEMNRRFGVYRNLCCGEEIVIADGTVFPECPNHPNLTTKWKSIADDEIRHVSSFFGKRETSSSAA